MTIRIDNLRFDAIIGLLESEREREQTVIVDLEIDYDYTPGNFLDYAAVAEAVTEHIQSERYELLEEALLGLRSLLCRTFPEIDRLRCRLKKPHILPHAEVSVSREWICGNSPEKVSKNPEQP